jgi:hypothetical protein
MVVNNEREPLYFCSVFETELKNVLNVGIFCRYCTLEDDDMEIAAKYGTRECKHLRTIPLGKQDEDVLDKVWHPSHRKCY